MAAVSFLGTRRCCTVPKLFLHSVREILKGIFAGDVTFSMLVKGPGGICDGLYGLVMDISLSWTNILWCAAAAV